VTFRRPLTYGHGRGRARRKKDKAELLVRISFAEEPNHLPHYAYTMKGPALAAVHTANRAVSHRPSTWIHVSHATEAGIVFG
jgi:hypothetical protein